MKGNGSENAEMIGAFTKNEYTAVVKKMLKALLKLKDDVEKNEKANAKRKSLAEQKRREAVKLKEEEKMRMKEEEERLWAGSLFSDEEISGGGKCVH